MKFSSLLGLAAFCTLAATAMAKNPIVTGWYADPEVAVFNNEYWIYPTYSAEYEKQTFMDAFSSKDLVNWTKHERIIDTDAVKWAKRAMWAPCTVEKGGKYYLFFAANDVHKGEVGGIGVAVSDSPAGPFKDLLGKPLINDIVNGAQPIDQAVFKDGMQWYIIYGGWGHCNLAKLKSDFTALEPFEDGKLYKEVTPEGYVEGPLMFERRREALFHVVRGRMGRRKLPCGLRHGRLHEWPVETNRNRHRTESRNRLRGRASLCAQGCEQPVVHRLPPPPKRRNWPRLPRDRDR